MTFLQPECRVLWIQVRASNFCSYCFLRSLFFTYTKDLRRLLSSVFVLCHPSMAAKDCCRTTHSSHAVVPMGRSTQDCTRVATKTHFRALKLSIFNSYPRSGFNYLVQIAFLRWKWTLSSYRHTRWGWYDAMKRSTMMSRSSRPFSLLCFHRIHRFAHRIHPRISSFHPPLVGGRHTVPC